MSDDEKKEWDLKLRKLDAEIANLQASTAKLNSENRYYPLVVGAAAMAAAIGLARIAFM